jgi:cleavage and polyadenylation specificity factor subunit 2
MHSKVPLEGAELEEYLSQERAVREREAAAQSALARSQRMLEADEGGDDESDSSDEEDAAESGADPNSMKIDESGGAGLDWSMLDTAEDSQARAQQVSFDIYLRGNTVARTATSFFKSGAVDASSTAEAGAVVDGDVHAPESTLISGEGLTRYRMFPLVERRKRVDGYGEMLDVGAWMRKSRALEEEAKTAANASSDTMQLEGEVEISVSYPLRVTINVFPERNIQVQEANVPSKFVVNYVEVPLHCQAFYVDMEGLNDGRAIKTIVPQVNPRKMVRCNFRISNRIRR